MGQLFAISFDSASSPAISFSANNKTDFESMPLYGWGFAWYPANENAAMVIKDATSPFNNSLTQVLQDWKHFRSTNFICHLRGASKRISQTATQPFLRSYAARDWIMVHDGDISSKSVRALQGNAPWFFEPLGKTDSELAFCVILNHLQARSARRLADYQWEPLCELLTTLANYGTANFIICDGSDMVLYHGSNCTHDLHWCRRKPPYEDIVLEADNLKLDLGDPLDLNRTAVIVATAPLSNVGWHKMIPGQMLVVRRGAIIFDNMMTKKIDFSTTLEISQPALATAPIVKNEVTNWGDRAVTRVFNILHETIYRYQHAVEQSIHTLRLVPVHDEFQEVLDYQFEIYPALALGNEKVDYEDVFGNQAAFFQLEQPYTELRLVSRSTVKIIVPPAVDLTAGIRRSMIPLMWMPWQRQMMLSYLLPSELPESQLRELSDYAMSFVERNDYDLFETLLDMNNTIHQDWAYAPGSTTLKSTPFEVFTTRQGVCQDFANLMICMARLLNIPARYRVGYIDTHADHSNTIQSEASHAWVELYLPYVGWRGFDPTNGCLVTRDHIRVACGRNYRDAAPTSGTIYKGGEDESLYVRVQVTPVE